MRKWLKFAILIAILVTTAVLRFTGIDWDGYNHYHPDERYIAWVATSIEWPADWSTAFSPHDSSINPFHWSPDAESLGIVVLQDEDRDFAYGHFPLYLGVAVTRLFERIGPALAPLFPADWLFTRDILNGSAQIEFRQLTAVTRALTALFDIGTVFVVFLLGRRIYNTHVGLLAAAFMAVNVMHIQLAHFFAFDPYMTFFVVTAVYFMALTLPNIGSGDFSWNVPAKAATPERKRPFYLILAAIIVGLAIGSKFAAVLLFFPLAFTVWLMPERRWFWVIMAVSIAIITFVITNPFAVLDLTCEAISPAIELGPITMPALDWRSCFLDNMFTQGAMVRGDIDLPFTRQYLGTIPFLYFIEMQLRWGMGPLLGILAFTGFAWAIWQTAKKLALGARARERKTPSTEYGLRITNSHSALSTQHSALTAYYLLLLSWSIPYFLSTGSFYVKFMRYMQPLTPFLMLFGAVMLVQMPWKKWRLGVGTAVLVTTTLYAFAFVNQYQQDHPWNFASAWVYANIPPGTLILSEQWDDALPTSMWFDGEWRQRSEYQNAELTWLTRTGERDSEENLMANLNLLAEADYLTIMTNRTYGVVPRLPQKFPISSQYHQLLFDGSLGYEPAYLVDRHPNLFGMYLYADTFGEPELRPPKRVTTYLDARPHLNFGRADESFIVYDQPLTIVFRNTGHLTVTQMRQQFVITTPDS